MKKILSWIMVLAMLLSLMPAVQLTASAAGFTETTSLPIGAGSVLSDKTIYTVSDNTIIQGSTNGNGLNVQAGATVIIYIPTGVTLTVNGGNGSTNIGGGAGIYLPGSSTLIVTGAGTLTIKGGNGGSSTSAGSGASGWLSQSGDGTFAGGNGGAGGSGAGGGGAGIGGSGGNGGSGGSGGSFGSSVACFHPEGRKIGGSGIGGSTGGAGSTAGSFYVLGGVVTNLSGGSSGSASSGGGGGGSVNDSGSGWSNCYTASGGGGGGGGGVGTGGASFGQGGGGGGGGGGGAAGSTWTDPDNYYYYVGWNGAGGVSGGGSGSAGNNGPGSSGYNMGAGGGAGGSQGSGGTAGTITNIPATVADQAASYPAAARYDVSFDNQGATTAGTANTVAVYGLNLATIIPPAKTGYTFDGYYTGTNGGGTQVYTAAGAPTSIWTTMSDTTLYAKWTRNFYTIPMPTSSSVTQNGVTASVVYSADASDIQGAKYGYGAAVTATIYFNGTAVNNAVHKILLTGDVPISGSDASGKSISVAAGSVYSNKAVASCTITVPAHDATTMSLSHALTIPLSLYNVEKTYTGSPIEYFLGGDIPGVTSTTITYTGNGATSYGPSTTAPTGAGTYSVLIQFATDTANGYEALGDVTRTLTIKPATLSWNASGLSAEGKDYDGSSLATLSGSLSATGAIGMDDVSLDSSYILNDTVKAYFENPLPGLSKTVTVDTSHLSLTGANASNYALPLQGPTLTATITGVAPTVVVVVSNPDSQSYDGSEKPVSGIAKFYGTAWLLLNGASDSNISFTYYTDSSCTSMTTGANSGTSTNGGAPAEAGQYYVKATYTPGNGQEMYQKTVSDAVPYSITPQEITAVVDWDSGEGGPYTYNGSAFTPSVTVYTDSTKAEQLTPDTDYKVTYSNNTNAGTAQIAVTLIGNYSPTVDTVLTKDFTIKRATYEMSKVGFPSVSDSLPYDKASHSMAVYPLLSFFSANDGAGNVNINVDDVTMVYHYACDDNGYDSEIPPVNSGIYTVTATYTSTNQNYNFDNDSNVIVETATLTIQQITPTIIIYPTAGPITAGNNLSLSVLGSEGYVYGLNERVVGTFEWASLDSVMGASGVVADYSVTFTPTDAFAVGYTAVNGAISVTPTANTYALGLAATSGSFTAVDYQAASNTVTYTVTNNSTIALSDVDVALDGTNADMFMLNKSGFPSTLPIGGSATFTVTSLTSKTGTFTVTVSVSGTKNAIEGGGSIAKTLDISQTVNKLSAPAFTWPADSYTTHYGQTLGSLTLPTDANGVFSWIEGNASSVGSVGSNAHVMAYTPNNLNYDYSGASGWDSATNTVRQSYAITVMAMGGALTAPLTAEKVAAVFGDGATFTDGTPPVVTITKDIVLSDSIIIETDMTIDLNGHTITAPEGKPAIVVAEDDVDITITGTGGVKGGKGTDGSTGGDGSPAIDFGDTTGGTVTVDTGVTVTGGNGGSGTSGEGGNGGAGISGNDVDITIKGTAQGGSGGTGTTAGGTGGTGTNSGIGTITIETGATSTGGVGGNGGTTGGAGGSGATSTGGNITVNGTSTGGNGGTGTTTGGAGGSGTTSSSGDVTVNGKSEGGTGGTGITNGGAGGTGTNSGTGTVTIESGATSTGGNGGNGTTGGAGGSGTTSNSGDVTVNGKSEGGTGGTGTTTGGAGGTGVDSKTGNVSGSGTVSGGTGGSSTSSSGTSGKGGVAASTGGTDSLSGTKTNGSNGTKPSHPAGGGGSSSSSDSSLVPVLVNGKTIDGGTQTTGKTSNGRDSTTVTVDTPLVDAQLKTAGANATITVPISGDQSVKSGVLTGDMVKKLESQGATLQIDTGQITYIIPAEEIGIDQVAVSFGGTSLSDVDIIVTIDSLSGAGTQFVKDAAADNGFTRVLQPVTFTVTATYSGKTHEISIFSNYVKRQIAIPDGIDPSKITTAVVIDTDGSTHHVPTKFTVVDGKHYAVINSLTNSTYTLVWNLVTFKDVKGHWAQAAINDMGSRTVISGVGGGSYEPDRNITRAEFDAIVVRALGLDTGLGSASFTDVSSSAWYYGYIQTVVGYGIVSGYGNGTFGPNDTITREQAMTMIARAMKLTGLAPKLSDTQIDSLLSNFKDSAGISNYAKEGVAACAETGVVLGKPDGTVASKDSITRAEVAVIIERLLQKSNLI